MALPDPSRLRIWGAALGLVLLSVGVSARAAADDYETELLDGVAARDRALETRDERDWRQAWLHLKRAVELQSTAEAEFELAEVAARLELWPEAYGAYQAALALGIDGMAETRAREFLAQHEGQMAALVLSGPGGAVVFVGGRQRGVLPLSRPLAVPVGALAVRLELPGVQSWQWQLRLSPGTVTPLSASLPPPASPGAATPLSASSGSPAASRWARPALIGGASLFALSGAGIAITSALLPSAHSDLQEHCADFNAEGQCVTAPDDEVDAAQSAANRVTTLETLRWVAVGGAVAGLAGAVLGYLGLPSAAPNVNAGAVQLRVGPQGLGIECAGRF
jgi:hypothetical protein